MAAVALSFWLLLLLLAFPPSSMADPSDEACLTDLYNSLQDPNKALRNWSKTTFAAPCSGFFSYLQGATCNNGRILKLSLPGLSLSGTLSPSLSNCTNLQSLDLSSNSLSGPIPPQLAACPYLNVIDLHRNRLSGPIPQEFGLLARLTAFDVSDNHLSGPIPSLLANRTGTGLPKFNASSFQGNKGLYGYPLPPAKNRGLSILAIIGIGLGPPMEFKRPW